MADVHRNTDTRVCGATTTVVGNIDVFANNLLVSVNGDPNSHGAGELIAHSNEVYADNILTVNHTPDTANADNKCPVPPHCAPETDKGSPNVCSGDPKKAPIVVLPPPVVAKIELQVETYLAEPYVRPPGYVPTEDEKQQMEENLDDTVDVEEGGDIIAEEEHQVYEDVCHPFDGVLDQHLLESSKDLWDETGMDAKYIGTYPNGAYENPSNPKILKIWDDIGFRGSKVWETDQTAWCMGYVNYVLKMGGYQWFQTSTALHADIKRDKFGFTEIPYENWDEAKCGDVCLWKFPKKRKTKGKWVIIPGEFSYHVNFLYTNKNQRMSFVGGNQKDAASSDNNPSGGAVTHSWRGSAESPFNKKGKKDGLGDYFYKTRGHDTNLIKIFRPKKI